MIAGIILAAGASSRMGSPKALLDYRGEKFVARLIRLVSSVGDPVIVALGYHADTIRAAIPAHVTVVINPAPERGQLSSLQAALAMVPIDAEGFMFSPVDSPAVEGATIDRLAVEFQRREPSSALVIPRYSGKHGHPVFAARAIADELLALDPTAQARQVVHRHVLETAYIDVDDPGILIDIDDPAAYRLITGSAT